MKPFLAFLEDMCPKVQAERPDVGGVERGQGGPLSCSLQGHVTEEVGHRLAVVGSSDGLGQDHGDVDDLEETSPFTLQTLSF